MKLKWEISTVKYRDEYRYRIFWTFYIFLHITHICTFKYPIIACHKWREYLGLIMFIIQSILSFLFFFFRFREVNYGGLSNLIRRSIVTIPTKFQKRETEQKSRM